MVRTEGWRTGPPAVLERLLDPVEGDKVSPEEYRFRLFVRFETGDERYRWVNEGMWIGSGIRRGLEGELVPFASPLNSQDVQSVSVSLFDFADYGTCMKCYTMDIDCCESRTLQLRHLGQTPSFAPGPC